MRSVSFPWPSFSRCGDQSQSSALPELTETRFCGGSFVQVFDSDIMETVKTILIFAGLFLIFILSCFVICVLCVWIYTFLFAMVCKIFPSFEERLKAKNTFRETYVTKRVFEAQEFEYEGLHYFIEVAEEKTLYFNGQYLYDFAPIEEEGEPRQFPSSEFVVVRHTSGSLINIECSGDPIEPEFIVPPIYNSDYYSKRKPPKDGDILEENYDYIAKALIPRRSDS